MYKSITIDGRSVVVVNGNTNAIRRWAPTPAIAVFSAIPGQRNTYGNSKSFVVVQQYSYSVVLTLLDLLQWNG